MPELCSFAGIEIFMRFDDVKQHYKPHVHVKYAEYNAVISLEGEILAGALPSKQLRMVTGWLAFREAEVYDAWHKAVKSEHFEKLLPLQ